MSDYSQLLHTRSMHTHNSVFDCSVTVEHLALINYLVPIERVEKFVKESDDLYIPKYSIDGKDFAVISIAPLLNVQLGFYKLIPFVKVTYPEMNFRLYVNEKKDETSGVLFMKMLSTGIYPYLARLIWRMPWFNANIKYNIKFNDLEKRYEHFEYSSQNKQDVNRIMIKDTGMNVLPSPPFKDIAHEKLIITHPEHAFSRTKGHTFAYVTAYHQEMDITAGEPIDLYFSFLEEQEILTKHEMLHPHSIFLSRRIPYKVDGWIRKVH